MQQGNNRLRAATQEMTAYYLKKENIPFGKPM